MTQRKTSTPTGTIRSEVARLLRALTARCSAPQRGWWRSGQDGGPAVTIARIDKYANRALNMFEPKFDGSPRAGLRPEHAAIARDLAEARLALTRAMRLEAADE